MISRRMRGHYTWGRERVICFLVSGFVIPREASDPYR
jgi:hypothetical protein